MKLRHLVPLALMASAAGAFPLHAEANDKVFVCKYVGTPGDNETLQTGQNPISVSVNAIPVGASIGAYFADAQGRSLVIAFDTGQPEPSCPGSDGSTTTEGSTTTWATTTTANPTTTIHSTTSLDPTTTMFECPPGQMEHHPGHCVPIDPTTTLDSGPTTSGNTPPSSTSASTTPPSSSTPGIVPSVPTTSVSSSTSSVDPTTTLDPPLDPTTIRRQSNLPTTGADTIWAIIVGAAALFAGIMLLLAVRHKAH